MVELGSPTEITRIMKIIVTGEMPDYISKSTLIRLFVEGCRFNEFYKTTIGVDFANKKIQVNDKLTVNVQLWDIASQERYGNMSHVYYQESSGAIIVFAVNHPNEFDGVELWKKDIESKVFTSEGKPVPILLIGCLKGDINENWKPMEAKYRKYSEENGFVGYFTVDLNTGSNVEESITKLVNYILENNIEPQMDHEPIDLKTPYVKHTNNTKREVCLVQ
ncbi:Ras family protein [Histomonas meleagridis]|uniref:Ras family protein n=1 Tax=Histomonas meleagridis TaxID=135588 RepID=UPI00355980FA|nr:Ras family protein [Histomonas meleagridis]KAH0803414.1 Ras family protein [Histomonas meleagridis]